MSVSTAGVAIRRAFFGFCVVASDGSLAYDFFGPAQPRSKDACTVHFERVQSEYRSEINGFIRSNCRIDNVTNSEQQHRYSACYDKAGAARASYHEQMMSGRKACWLRAESAQQQMDMAAEVRRRNEQNARSIQRERDSEARNLSGSAGRLASVDKQQAIGQAAGALLSHLFREKVEKEMEPEPPNQVSNQVKEHNARSFEIFDKARDRMRFHPVAKQFQDLFFDQLDNQMQVITDQLSKLERSTSEILQNVKSEHVIDGAPGRKVLRQVITDFPNAKLDYFGQLDDQGRPNGQGFASGEDSQGMRIKYFGYFANGHATGFGTYEDIDGDGMKITVQGQFTEGEPQGSRVTTRTDTRRNRTSISYGEVGNGNVVRIRFVEGTVFEGRIADGQPPQGWGLLHLPNSSFGRGLFQGREIKSPAIIQMPNGITKRCEGASWTDTQFICKGVTRTDRRDGGYTIDNGLSPSSLGWAAVEYRPPSGGIPGYVKDSSMKDVDGKVTEMARIIWSNGATFEGEATAEAMRAASAGSQGQSDALLRARSIPIPDWSK